MKKLLILVIVASFSLEAKHSCKIKCSKIKSCEEAYEYLKKGHKHLDRDKDGIPCENLCDDEEPNYYKKFDIKK
jgi:hypothetical protein